MQLPGTVRGLPGTVRGLPGTVHGTISVVPWSSSSSTRKKYAQAGAKIETDLLVLERAASKNRVRQRLTRRLPPGRLLTYRERQHGKASAVAPVH